MDSTRLAKISRTYDRHPLRAATIVERLANTGRLSNLSEDDLATDDATFITDQNHTGGLQAVVELARLVDLQRTDRVLDIGTGLGGTPRVLADRYGCRCHGVELTTARYNDAVELTRRVGLRHLVTFSYGDFLNVNFPQAPFNVIIGQDTFMHFEDLHAVLRKCSPLLATDGNLVIEDGFLRRAPATEIERSQLAAAWDQWNGRFPSLREWQNALRSCGFGVDRSDDRTDEAIMEYQLRMQSLPQVDRRPERHELSGWSLGEALMRSGVIGTMRILCRRQRSNLITPLNPSE